jgi:hypothetical protein
MPERRLQPPQYDARLLPGRESRIIGPMRAAVLLFGLASGAGFVPATAQQPDAGAESRPTESKRVLVDAVIATVNDSTILRSELLTTAAGTIRTAMDRVGQLSSAEINALYNRELDDLIDHRRMALAAKTLGDLTPDQVEQVLRAELEREKEDTVRDFGSYLAFSQELERTGRTWPNYAREKRIDKLFDLAEQFAIYQRLHKQSNLYLTPRMLRDTYTANLHQFQRPARAAVMLLVFRGPNAEADARAAAEIWRNEALTSRELADRFPGCTPVPPVLAQSLRPELAGFALKGPQGSVSEPFVRAANGGTVVELARVAEYAPARDGHFEDPDVQQEVRMMCEYRVVGEFRAQAFARARQQTEVWRASSGRTPPGRTEPGN